MSCSVSVLMSVYNGERYLREAVDSILAQSFRDFEFVVIDDGSTDATPEILSGYRDPRLMRFRIENRGLPAALNYGLERCSAELVFRMDADDVAYPQRFVALLEDWDRAGRPEVFGSGADYMDQNGVPLWSVDLPLDDAGIRSALLDPQGRLALIHPTVLLVKRAVLSCGGYDPYFRNGQDIDLWLRLSLRGRFGNSPRRLLKYRFQPNSDTARSITINDDGLNLGNWVHLLALQKKLMIDAGLEGGWERGRDRIVAALLERVDLAALQREAVGLRQLTDAKVLCYAGRVGDGLMLMARLLARDPFILLRRAAGRDKTNLSPFLLTLAELERLEQKSPGASGPEQREPGFQAP